MTGADEDAPIALFGYEQTDDSWVYFRGAAVHYGITAEALEPVVTVKIEGEDLEGKPVSGLLVMSPSQALSLADCLTESAGEANAGSLQPPEAV